MPNLRIGNNMIIAGNSHVSMFRKKNIVSTTTKKQLEIHWVGALTIDYFKKNHPAAQKIRDLFNDYKDWNFLSIGLHDYNLLLDTFANQSKEIYNKALNQMIKDYQNVFLEFSSGRKFGWLIAPQQRANVNTFNLTNQDILKCFYIFNDYLSNWCKGNNIVVINPLDKITYPDGYTKKEYLHADGIHLNFHAAEHYLNEIEQITGEKFNIATDEQIFEHILEPKTGPESLSILTAEEIGLKWDSHNISFGKKTIFENQLMTYISNRLRQKKINETIDLESDYIKVGKFNSPELIEIYTYASDIFGGDINFDLYLRDLNTVEKLSAFFQINKDLTINDFIHALTSDPTNYLEKTEILFTDYRIASMSKQLVEKLKESVYINTGGAKPGYGIIFFWYALIEAKNKNYDTALSNISMAQDEQLAYPFKASRLKHYQKCWENKKSGFDMITTTYKKDKKEPTIPLNILKKVPNKHDPFIDTEINNIIQSLYNHGETLLKNGQIEDAFDAYTRTIQICPDFAMAFFKKGIICWGNNQNNETFQLFNRAYIIDSTNKTIVLTFADFFRILNQSNNAIKIYNDYLHKKPGDTDVKQALRTINKEWTVSESLNLKGEILYNNGYIQGAIAALTEAITHDPNMAIAYNNLGVIYFEKGDIQKAKKLLTQALNIRPDDENTIRNFNHVLKKMASSI